MELIKLVLCAGLRPSNEVIYLSLTFTNLKHLALMREISKNIHRSDHKAISVVNVVIIVFAIIFVNVMSAISKTFALLPPPPRRQGAADEVAPRPLARGEGPDDLALREEHVTIWLRLGEGHLHVHDHHRVGPVTHHHLVHVPAG